MRVAASAILGTGMSLALCGIAAADSDWKTVTLDGGSVIDVPAVVGDDYKPDPKKADAGDLMYFSITTKSDGDLDCMLNRYDYTEQFTRADAVEKLADGRRDVLCTAGDHRSGNDVGESESLSVSGYPAGRCAASYTDNADAKQPGHLDAVMAVAAPDRFYLLSCTLYTASQDEATAEWMAGWNDEVHHMQQSFRP